MQSVVAWKPWMWGLIMGEVIEFPQAAGDDAGQAARHARRGRIVGSASQSASIVILPVIRIERFVDQPAEDPTPDAQDRSRRRRRRRVAR